MAKYFSDLSAWRELLAADFNRGYLSGVVLVLAVVLLFLVVRIALSFLFRTRRVRSIVVPAADGDVMISQNAVIAAVESLLTDFHELQIDSLKIYCCRRQYSLLLHCRFRLNGTSDFPDAVQKMKKTIFEGMRDLFGVSSLRYVRVVLTELERSEASGEKPSVPAEEPADLPEVPAEQI